MPARARQPSLLLHAGRLGAAVAARLSRQLGDSDARRWGALACCAATDDPGSLRSQLDALLGLPELLASASPTPRLVAFAVVDLAESEAAVALGAQIDRLVALVRRRYSALFADYRDAAQLGFSCNPILLLPPADESWPAASRTLLAHLEALHADRTAPAAVSNIFVLGESSARYLLPRDELEQMIAAFCELALCSELAADPELQRLLARGGDPFATFVCATAELDVGATRRYCATDAAIEVLDWLRRSSQQRADIAERAPELAELFDLRRYRELIRWRRGRARWTPRSTRSAPASTPRFATCGCSRTPRRRSRTTARPGTATAAASSEPRPRAGALPRGGGDRRGRGQRRRAARRGARARGRLRR